ncbi:MAG: ABC transporter substrate-binding protein [Dehalococcoidales bacterium]|nr:ABC transporter substrate-binding protein [Dehalococcoidales bacterium]
MRKWFSLLLAATALCFLPILAGSCVSQGADTVKDPSRFGGIANVRSAQAPAGDKPKISISNYGYPCTITDYLGYEIQLDTAPERVAVLSGSFINLWYALGGKSICRTELGSVKLDSQHAAEIEALPSVGMVYNTNVEAVIAFKPDFIIAQAGVQSSICKTLREMDYKIATLFMRTYRDVLDHMRVFGALLDRQTLVEEMIARMEARKQEIIARLPEESKRVVILYVTSSTIAVKLDNSIAGDVANILRLKNIASGLPPDVVGSENTPLDIEYIVEKEPDVVLVTSMISSNEDAKRMMKEKFATNPAWGGIRAIKEGRVVYLPQEYFLYNAGHNYVDAIEYMAKGVYPEIFGALEE